VVGADDDRDDPSGRGACGSGRLCRDGDYQHEHFNVGGQRTTVPLALAPLRGEFDLDLGAKGAGDFFERRQRHAIVILPIQARDVGLLHAGAVACRPAARARPGANPFFNLARIKPCAS